MDDVVMGEPRGDETGPGEAEADELANELGRVRRRGLSLLDRSRGKQEPIQAPILESLASQAYPCSTQRDRVVLIQRFLDDARQAFSDQRNPQVAGLIRRLLSDAKGRWPGPGGPGALLKEARSSEGIQDEDEFRKLQRQRFVEFARFLLIFLPPDDTEPPQSLAREDARRVPSGRLIIAGVIAAVLAVAGIMIAIVGARTPSKPHTAGSSTPQSTISGSSAAPGAVQFRFDNLGSTYPGGSIIEVYPGVLATPTDRTHNGSYNNGEIVRALCVTSGRTVVSDPHYNETPRTTDLWVRIASSSTQPQYATLTYGDLVPPSAKLPNCADVS